MQGASLEQVVIIGTGPAGLTAAIYSARANLQPLVIEGEQPGGQLTITSDVENYPGFAEPVMGPELMEAFKKQAARFGTRFLTGRVAEVQWDEKRGHRLRLDDGKQILARTVIIATGASAKWVGLPNETRLRGKGVSACATCDGFFFRNQDVVVVGGGDTAMEEANFLTRFAKTVTIVHRRDTLRASKIMQDRAFKNPKIRFIWDSEVSDVLGQKAVEGVELLNLKTGQKSTIAAQGLFLAIGHQPNTQIFKGNLRMDETGYLWVNPGTARTSVQGVYAAGDVADPVYRQAVTAAGTGCMAAIEAERYLESLGHGQ